VTMAMIMAFMIMVVMTGHDYAIYVETMRRVRQA
jgi:Flp pilus assembly protein TadG